MSAETITIERTRSDALLDRLRVQLNLERHDDDDAFLLGKIAAASAWIVSYCGMKEMPDDVPPALEEATLQLAAHLWTHRGDNAETVNVPAIVRSLVAPWYEWAV